MIYAYAVGDAGNGAPSRPRGLGGAMLHELESGGLAAVFSRHRTLRPRPSRDLVLSHERVVEAIMRRGAVLPLRFGTVLDSEDQLVAALTERNDELRRALERVRGRVELSVRLLDPAGSRPAGPSHDGSGRAYLLARAAEHRRARRVAEDIHQPLGELAVASIVRDQPRPSTVLTAAYLVDVDRVSEFQARAADLAARSDETHLVLTGPWPPYSFVAEAAA